MLHKQLNIFSIKIFTATVIGVYVILLLFIVIFQRSFIYLPPANDNPETLVTDLKRLGIAATYQQIKINNINHISFIFIPPRGQKKIFIMALGNAHDNHTRRVDAVPLVERGFGVLVLGYPGYGGNTGKPSERSLYTAARAQIKWLFKNGVKPADIVLYGQSLGSGIAVQMATEFPVGSLILEVPFTSAIDMAAIRFPYFPTRYFLWDRFDNLQKITNIHQPTLILYGDHDTVIPAGMGHQLYAASPAPRKQEVVMPGAGHDNMLHFKYNGQSMMDIITDFVSIQN